MTKTLSGVGTLGDFALTGVGARLPEPWNRNAAYQILTCTVSVSESAASILSRRGTGRQLRS
jgi:hypothetical protein